MVDSRNLLGFFLDQTEAAPPHGGHSEGPARPLEGVRRGGRPVAAGELHRPAEGEGAGDQDEPPAARGQRLRQQVDA